MPIIQAFLLEGRSDAMKADFIAAVTEAAYRSLGAPKESVRIIISEMAPTNFGVAGQSFEMKQRQAKEAGA